MSHRTVLIVFATTLVVAVLAAFLTTSNDVDSRSANFQAPPGATGLARPRRRCQWPALARQSPVVQPYSAAVRQEEFSRASDALPGAGRGHVHATAERRKAGHSGRTSAHYPEPFGGY